VALLNVHIVEHVNIHNTL